MHVEVIMSSIRWIILLCQKSSTASLLLMVLV